MIPFRAHRIAIEKRYTDRATVKRVVPTKTAYGETIANKDSMLTVYADQPCYFSQSSVPNTGQTDMMNMIQVDYKIFIAPELVIKAGDRIEIVRPDDGEVTMWYPAGKPSKFPTHQEVKLSERLEYA